PIFDIPDSNTVELLFSEQARTPGSYLAVTGYRGATLNGLGLRSVSHLLIRPQPEFFRKYFPGMDKDDFDHVFNRYAAVSLQDLPLPVSQAEDGITLPNEVFRPIQNLRRAVIEHGDGRCPAVRDQVNAFGLSLRAEGPNTAIEGWAP